MSLLQSAWPQELFQRARRRKADGPASSGVHNVEPPWLGARKALDKFSSLLESESDIKLRMEYEPIVAKLEIRFTTLYERRFGRNLADIETLIALVQEEQKIYVSESRKYENHRKMAVYKELWDTVESQWKMRIAQEELYRRHRTPKSTGGAVESNREGRELEEKYRKLLIRMLNPQMSNRTSKGNIDLGKIHQFKAQEAATASHRRIYSIAPDASIEGHENGVIAVKEIAYKTKHQRCRIEEESTLLVKAAGHAHVVTCIGFAFDEEAKVGRIFMEYLEGGDLRSLIYYNGIIGERESKPILRQTLLGIRFLHKMNIVHRAIASENILIDIQGGIKLGGFGSAQEVSGRQLSPLQQPGYTGLELWMSPEMARREELKVKHPFRTDIWSFGCVIIEAITGQPPWTPPRVLFQSTEEEQEFCMKIKSELAIMGTKCKCEVKGPPFSTFLTRVGREVLSQIFTKSERRIEADKLLENPWLCAPPGILMPDIGANDPKASRKDVV